MSKFLRRQCKTGHIVTLTMNEPISERPLKLDQYADFEKYCARINQDYDVQHTGAGRPSVRVAKRCKK